MNGSLQRSSKEIEDKWADKGYDSLSEKDVLLLVLACLAKKDDTPLVPWLHPRFVPLILAVLAFAVGGGELISLLQTLGLL